jgi:hypothetical protein
MFFNACSPISSKARSSRPAASSCTRAETQIPPGQRLQPGGDVDPVTEDVAIFNDDVALVDADAEFEAPVRRGRGVAFRHRALHLGGAAQRIDDAGELNEHSVAGRLDDASLMFGDAWIDQLAPQCPERRERTLLVGADQPRVAGDIGGEDRR